MALAAIFVGGKARRMGGVPKGLLALPGGGSLIERTVGIARACGLEPILAGTGSAYAHLGIALLADEPKGIGPLGGLIAVLRRAGEDRVIAIACDMPFVSQRLLARLVAYPSGAPVIAARRDACWEPLFARYDAARVLPIAERRAAAKEHALQGLLDAAGAEALPLAAGDAAELRDWDTPADMAD